MVDTIGIQHRNDLENDILSQYFGHRVVADQEVDDT